MTETPQQYTQRIVAHTSGQEPLKIQAATPKKLQRLLGRATASKLRAPSMILRVTGSRVSGRVSISRLVAA